MFENEFYRKQMCFWRKYLREFSAPPEQFGARELCPLASSRLRPWGQEAIQFQKSFLLHNYAIATVWQQ